jgi:hypothetical protein
LVISSNFYKSSWDDTLLITLLLVTIRALAKLTNRMPKDPHDTNYVNKWSMSIIKNTRSFRSCGEMGELHVTSQVQ